MDECKPLPAGGGAAALEERSGSGQGGGGGPGPCEGGRGLRVHGLGLAGSLDTDARVREGCEGGEARQSVR